MKRVEAEKKSWLDMPISKFATLNVETLLIAAILVLAVLSRFYMLGARVMSHDEVNHVVPSFDLYEGRGYRYDPMSHGPLQFHLIAWSYFLFGDNDFTSRIPAAIFSVATIGAVLWLYRRYLGRVGALVAGLLLLISPYMLFYGRYARNEVFIVLWGALTLYAILRYLESGEAWVLYLFTAVNGLHFIDKATSYIFAVEQSLFLAGYFVYRISLRDWRSENHRRRFLILLLVALVLACLVLALAQASKAMLLLAALAALTCGVAAALTLVQGVGWEAIRAERSFDLLLLLGTLVLPLLAAVPVELLGFSPTDSTSAGILRAIAAVAPLTALAIAGGLWWNARLWLWNAAAFYLLFATFYTTFFTYGTGLVVGWMGALGYWMEQQAVNRGSQPWFYYALLQVPMYEFLPALGTLCLLYTSDAADE